MGKNKEEKKQGGRNVQPQEQEDQAPQHQIRVLEAKFLKQEQKFNQMFAE